MDRYNHEELRQLCKNVFSGIGFSTEHADMAADVLISAELRGIPSHGVLRLADYVRLWREKRLNATPEIKTTYETPSTAVVDGDQGSGLVVGQVAMEIAIEKAKNVGTGWVAVNNSNHYGIAAYHAMLALKHDMIGITTTNANPSVAPTYSTERLLGTNPIAIVVPAKSYEPFVADMATSPVARGKIVIALKKDEPLPFGYVQDKDGNPCSDPKVLLDGGSLVPLGSDSIHGSHKGYCLGSAVDILSGVLSGASFSSWVPPISSYQKVVDNMPGVGTGHFFGALRIDAFRPADEFKEKMDVWIERMKSSKTTVENDRVMIPGEPETEREKHHLEHGIPVIKEILCDLKKLSKELKFDFNLKAC